MKILSISDIITNSSSEVFCVISHPNTEVLDQIHSDLCDFFDSWKQEYETTLYIEDFNPDIDSDFEIEVPYSKSKYLELYETIINKWLKENYKDYNIEYHHERF